MCFQFIVGVDCQYESVFTQSGLGRDSYLYGIGFFQVLSSSLPVKDDVFPIHSRSVENSVGSTKLYLHNLVSVAIRICKYRVFPCIIKQVTRQREVVFFNSSPQRLENGVVSTKLYLQFWPWPRFVFVWYRVLASIIKQVTRQRRCFPIRHRAFRKRCAKLDLHILVSVAIRIWLYKVLPIVIKQVIRQRRCVSTLIAAACRKRCCQYEASRFVLQSEA